MYKDTEHSHPFLVLACTVQTLADCETHLHRHTRRHLQSAARHLWAAARTEDRSGQGLPRPPEGTSAGRN